MLTYFCRSHVKIASPDNGLLLVQFANVLFEMDIPLLLGVKGLETPLVKISLHR